jgi:hypothetical protein
LEKGEALELITKVLGLKANVLLHSSKPGKAFQSKLERALSSNIFRKESLPLKGSIIVAIVYL